MSASIKRVAYYHATVKDRPGEAYRLLSQLAEAGVNLLAFSAVPSGSGSAQLIIFPERENLLLTAAESGGISLSGPEHAFICQGDDELGAFAKIHRDLFDANVNVYASSGVSADCGRFAYVVYVKADQVEHAARVLGL
jgi:hypothetical protein